MDSLFVVLHKPRDIRNIGGVVRAMKNTGLSRLRLVAPPPFEAGDIGGIAHRSEDVLAHMQTFATLDEALADAHVVVGTSARTRGDHMARSDIRTLATELRARATHERVALVFGSEDNGLDNAALDRCHVVLHLPINPAYPSLNLAQAVLLVGYELWMAGEPSAIMPPVQPSASAAQYETLFHETEHALRSIAFFKAGSAPTMRTIRQAAFRARLSEREAMLLSAIAREVMAFLRRTTISDDRRPTTDD